MSTRKNISGKVCRTRGQVKLAEREFLNKLTPEDRIELTWQLSQMQWEWKRADVAEFLPDGLRHLLAGKHQQIFPNQFIQVEPG